MPTKEEQIVIDEIGNRSPTLSGLRRATVDRVHDIESVLRTLAERDLPLVRHWPAGGAEEVRYSLTKAGEAELH